MVMIFVLVLVQLHLVVKHLVAVGAGHDLGGGVDLGLVVPQGSFVLERHTANITGDGVAHVLVLDVLLGGHDAAVGADLPLASLAVKLLLVHPPVHVGHQDVALLAEDVIVTVRMIFSDVFLQVDMLLGAVRTYLHVQVSLVCVLHVDPEQPGVGENLATLLAHGLAALLQLVGFTVHVLDVLLQMPRARTLVSTLRTYHSFIGRRFLFVFPKNSSNHSPNWSIMSQAILMKSLHVLCQLSFGR